jgi:hypothetical protein
MLIHCQSSASYDAGLAAGNPGITYFNDQLGLNSRTFDDILLYDAVITGCHAEHAAAAEAARALPFGDIRVGFPHEVFVELNLPDAVVEDPEYFGADGLFSCRASDNIVQRLERARSLLCEAGMVTVQEDWPDVESSARLGRVNALYHMQFGHEYAPGLVYNSVASGSHSFTGQIAAWLDQYAPLTD